jgi:hypothetical protein
MGFSGFDSIVPMIRAISMKDVQSNITIEADT